MTQSVVSRITIYPIKSFDGIDVESANCLPGGALQYDRQFAIVAADGSVLNAKRTAQMHQLAADYDLAAGTVSLRSKVDERSGTFDLFNCDRSRLIGFLQEFFGQPLTIDENTVFGFPDDTESAGLTLISDSTLNEVSSWFDLTIDEIHRRFRTNVCISGTVPFAEDALFAPATADTASVEFSIAGINYFGTNPCQRCIVPTRSSENGDLTPGFAEVFRKRREQTLPKWAAQDRFDHFYRLSINTVSINCRNRTIQVGDPVDLPSMTHD